MRRTSMIAWSVDGGVGLRPNSGPVDLYTTERGRFVLTLEPDAALEKVDRGNAIRRHLARRTMGQDERTFMTALAGELEAIGLERKEKIQGQTVLVAETSVDVEPPQLELLTETDEFVIARGVSSRSAQKKSEGVDLDAMKTALALESRSRCKFERLTDGSFLTRDDGKTVYGIHFEFSSETRVVRYLGEEDTARIKERYQRLRGFKELADVQRLMTQMSDESDPVQAFLSGFRALERLVGGAFPRQKKSFFSPLVQAEHPSLRENLLERLETTIEYNLGDKFRLVTIMLFSRASEADIKDDVVQFSHFKALRDNISHGDVVSEDELPLEPLNAMLKKYVQAVTET